ncbi:hypothetical protein [Saccharolobus islandicus]
MMFLMSCPPIPMLILGSLSNFFACSRLGIPVQSLVVIGNS